MHNPPHPGGIVRRQCLEPLGLTITEAAEGLGVTRQALSDLVNERAGVSVEMAIRLSKGFGSSPKPGWGCRWPMISGRRASGWSIPRSANSIRLSVIENSPGSPTHHPSFPKSPPDGRPAEALSSPSPPQGAERVGVRWETPCREPKRCPPPPGTARRAGRPGAPRR
jgi:addiction module HigA family antidote